jgi:hypothetical protein
MLQIIYASAASKKMTGEELEEILETARRNNSEKGISGMLLYHGGSFLQVLEGPDEELKGLIAKIKADERNDKIKLLFMDRVDEKEFDDWSMGFVDASRTAELMEGYVNFGAELNALTLEGSLAKRVLRQFKEGSWRQYVH